jgi:hypothetical protein
LHIPARCKLELHHNTKNKPATVPENRSGSIYFHHEAAILEYDNMACYLCISIFFLNVEKLHRLKSSNRPQHPAIADAPDWKDADEQIAVGVIIRITPGNLGG